MPFLSFRVKCLHPVCTQEWVGLSGPSDVVCCLRKNVQDLKAQSHRQRDSTRQRCHRDACLLSPFGCEQLLICHLACGYSMTPSPQLLPVLSAKKQRNMPFLSGTRVLSPGSGGLALICYLLISCVGILFPSVQGLAGEAGTP